MKWFKHDTNANRDKKLAKLIMRFGGEGYGLYWYCLEQIAEPIDVNNLNFELEHDAEILGHHLKIDAKQVEEMMRFMVDLELFEASGATITCLKLANRIEKSLVRSPQLKVIQDKLKLSETFRKSPKLSEAIELLRNDPETVGELSVLDIDIDIDLDFITATTTSATPQAESISASYSPSSFACDYLNDHSVSPEFIELYRKRFIAYWLDDRSKKKSWDSKFMEQCQKQFDIEVLKIPA
jgi:hypothetical protein